MDHPPFIHSLLEVLITDNLYLITNPKMKQSEMGFQYPVTEWLLTLSNDLELSKN